VWRHFDITSGKNWRIWLVQCWKTGGHGRYIVEDLEDMGVQYSPLGFGRQADVFGNLVVVGQQVHVHSKLRLKTISGYFNHLVSALPFLSPLAHDGLVSLELHWCCWRLRRRWLPSRRLHNRNRRSHQYWHNRRWVSLCFRLLYCERNKPMQQHLSGIQSEGGIS
jgi:hypothetical protein